MRGNSIKKRLMSFAFEKIPRISLSCMLVPVQYREYEYGLLVCQFPLFYGLLYMLYSFAYSIYVRYGRNLLSLYIVAV